MSAKTFSKHVIFLSISLILLLCFENAAYAIVSDKEAQKQAEYAPGQIIVKLREGKDAKTLFTQSYSARAKAQNTVLSKLKSKYNLKSEKPVFQSLHKQLKARNLSLEKFETNQLKSASLINKNPKNAKTPDLLPIYTLKTDQDVLATCAELKKDPNIEYAEPNYIMKVQMVPNDHYYSTNGSWGQSYDDLWGLKKIQCGQAWDISQGEGVVVAVIDTGIDYNHPDIAANIWTNPDEIPDNGIDDDGNGYIDDVRGWDFIGSTYKNLQEDNQPADGHGHGSHTAGTIAAVGNNNLGVVGVAPGTKVMPVKGLDDSGTGPITTLADCVIYAADNGADILSNSWGGAFYSQLLTDAFNYAHNNGCLSIAAAGNSNYDVGIFSPANISTVMAVAASDPNDEKAGFSNYGKLISVTAPGVDILSLRAQGTDMYKDGKHFVPPNDINANYYRANGTSMACPHVSGLAALVLSNHPSFSNIDIRNAICISSDDLGEIGNDLYFGWGRINAQRAVLQEPAPMIKVLNVNPRYLWLSGAGPEEQLSFSIEITNEWADAQNVNVALSTAESSIRIDNSSAAFGDLAHGEIKSSSEAPFTITVMTEVNDIIEIPLILEITTADGTIIRDRRESVYLVPSSVEGRPFVSLEGSPYLYRFKSGRAIADIDGDGTNEMVISAGSPNTIWWGGGLNTFDLFVFNNDGTVRTGWPIHIGFADKNVGNAGRHPALTDIDRDGEKEIIVSVTKTSGITPFYWAGEVRVYRPNGQMYPGWPVAIPGEVAHLYDAVVGDIDNDGLSEIIINAYRGSTGAGSCYVFRYDGSLLSGWPYTFTGELLDKGNVSYPAIGDVDGDGYKEIVVTTRSGKIHILGHDGQLKRIIDSASVGRSPWTYVTPNVVLANLDYDPECEIIFSPLTNKLFAYNADGTLVPGWPVSSDGGDTFLTHSVGDLNADSLPEIIAVTYYPCQYYVFSQDGARLLGFPKLVSQLFVAPILADVNSDGAQDIIYNTNDDGMGDINKIYAIDYHGQLIDGFPKIFRHPYMYDIDTCPSIRDFDNDGKLDLIMNFSGTLVNPHGGGSIYVVPLINSTVSSYIKTWPQFLHDRKNTSCYEVDPPHLNPIGNKAINENETLDFTVSVFDSDPDDILIYSASGLPEGAVFIPETRVFTWTPTYDQVGTYTNVHFEVTDGSLSTSEDITITVNNVNRPPVLAPIYNKVSNEDDLLQFTISATDPDGDTLTYLASNLPKGASFNPDTRTFRWIPTYEQAGIYNNVHFEVTDGYLTDSKNITITIINVNRSPILTPIGNKVVNEGSLLKFTILARDPDHDPITYSAINLPKGATINSKTGQFNWMPDYKQAGIYLVTFVASDGSLSDEEKVTIKVNNVMMPDLTTGAITYTVIGNKFYIFKAPIKNIGDKTVRTPFYVYFYVDGVIKGSRHIIRLAAGQTVISSFAWPAIKGTHTIKITADATGRIKEADENNNSAQITIVVK